jgi:hypothetical protein
MAFIKLESDRGSILKKGSLIGYLAKIRGVHYKDRRTDALFAPAQGDMLQNMRYSRCIWRICFEPNGEDIVCIISCNMEVLGTSFVML